MFYLLTAETPLFDESTDIYLTSVFKLFLPIGLFARVPTFTNFDLL